MIHVFPSSDFLKGRTLTRLEISVSNERIVNSLLFLTQMMNFFRINSNGSQNFSNGSRVVIL